MAARERAREQRQRLADAAQGELAAHFLDAAGGVELEPRRDEIRFRVFGRGQQVGLLQARVQHGQARAHGRDRDAQAQVARLRAAVDRHLARDRADARAQRRRAEMPHLERDEGVVRIELVRERTRNGLRLRGCDPRAGAEGGERRPQDDASHLIA